MRVSQCVRCRDFPCSDVKHECFVVPKVEVDPDAVSIVMVSEAAPEDAADYYYAKGDPLFQQTTVLVFNQAGAKVSTMRDILNRGVYVTTAVKCAKTGYGIRSETTRHCSVLLEKELALFPKAKVLMLMGDVAIKALNYIAQRAGEKRPIPAGSTYKLRRQEFFFRGKRVFPSYTQAGPSILIETGKQKVIAEDIAAALRL
jgi:uracil-DNA glycosylase